MSLKLYHAPGTCALAPLIALEEADVAFEAVWVDTAAGVQRPPEYLALNPKVHAHLLRMDGRPAAIRALVLGHDTVARA